MLHVRGDRDSPAHHVKPISSVRLERHPQVHMFSGEQRAKCYASRCPNLRGPMLTRPSFGRVRVKVPGTPSYYDLINSRDPGVQMSSVWRIQAVPRTEKLHDYHPTQKPLRLVRRAILASTNEGDLVFGPFCGSGTTGVAAKEPGRFFVGVEMEEEFAELAARRIQAAERGGVLREIP
jgi:hypothetical protein